MAKEKKPLTYSCVHNHHCETFKETGHCIKDCLWRNDTECWVQ
jgi:hypothetical protein